MGSYKNAMESLVEEEVDRQVKALPVRAASFVNQLELIAYALNQLPALYATSEKGFEYQLQRGRAKLGAQIAQAVQRAIAAIRRDPIRTYVPLQPSQQSVALKDVLQQLRLLLENDKIEWEMLPVVVKKALDGAGQKGMTWDAKYKMMPHSATHPNRKPLLPPPPPLGPPRTLEPSSRSADLRVASGSSYLQQSPPNVKERLRQNNVKRERGSVNRYEQPISPPSSEYGWDDPLYKT